MTIAGHPLSFGPPLPYHHSYPCSPQSRKRQLTSAPDDKQGRTVCDKVNTASRHANADKKPSSGPGFGGKFLANACIRGVPPERPLPRSRLPHFPAALRQLLLPHNQLPPSRLPHMQRCQRPHSRLQSPQLCKLLRLLCHNLLKSSTGPFLLLTVW